MMIDPTDFKESLRHTSLREVIKGRHSIIEKIHEYEHTEPAETDICMDPCPDVIYYCNLSHLSELCDLIQEKMHEERGDN